jgi:hypothetical protein
MIEIATTFESIDNIFLHFITFEISEVKDFLTSNRSIERFVKILRIPSIHR